MLNPEKVSSIFDKDFSIVQDHARKKRSLKAIVGKYNTMLALKLLVTFYNPK